MLVNSIRVFGPRPSSSDIAQVSRTGCCRRHAHTDVRVLGIEAGRSRQIPFPFTRNLSTEYIVKYAKKMWDEVCQPMRNGSSMKLNNVRLVRLPPSRERDSMLIALDVTLVYRLGKARRRSTGYRRVFRRQCSPCPQSCACVWDRQSETAPYALAFSHDQTEAQHG